MASEGRAGRHRVLRGLTEDEILDELNKSDSEFESDDSDSDKVYTSPETSSSSDEYEPENASSPAMSDSSVMRRSNVSTLRRVGRNARTRGTRGRRGQTITSAATSSVYGNIHDEWTERIFQPKIENLMQPAYLEKDTSNWEWHKFYEQYIDDEILSVMVDCTNRNNIFIKGRTLSLTVKELKVYLGITMIMSALQYPQIDMYWQEKFRVPIIAQAMPRNRFYAIRTSLKVVFDQDISSEQRKDKIWKVRPLLEKILRGCHEQPRPTHLCIDEMIIPFTGSCPIRQYCPNKPNPVGLKVFVMASPEGIVCDMLVYQGDSTFPHLISKGFSLGEAAVLHLTNSLVPGHLLFFDRYFTTVKLCDELLKLGLHGTGTIMKNRIPKNCIMVEEKRFKKAQRGTSEVKIRNDKKMSVTRWLDSKPVLMLSTCFNNTIQDDCDRWSKKNRIYEKVRRPEVIKKYNQNMGGVDLTDRMLSVCPSRNRTKKWTIRVISHLFDLSVVNAWLEYRAREVMNGKQKRKVEQLREYKLNLGTKLLIENDLSTDDESDPNEVEDLMSKHKKRKVLINPISSKERRQQKAAHMPEYGNKQYRCRNSHCDKKTTVFCKKCNIYLCFTQSRNCFSSFHEDVVN